MRKLLWELFFNSIVSLLLLTSLHLLRKAKVWKLKRNSRRLNRIAFILYRGEFWSRSHIQQNWLSSACLIHIQWRMTGGHYENSCAVRRFLTSSSGGGGNQLGVNFKDN